MAIQYTHYDLLDKIKNNNFSYVSSYKKKTFEKNTDVEALQEDLADFKKYVKKLNKYSPEGTTKAGLERQLKGLVKSYNSMKKSSDSITDSEIKKQIKKLEDLFEGNKKELKKIGIEISDKGKLSFDSQKFEEAEKKDINSLFMGKDCFIRKADKIMRGVDESADDAVYSITESKINKTTRYDEGDIADAYSYTLIKKTTENLTDYSRLMETDNPVPVDAEYKEYIKQCLDALILGYNTVTDSKYSSLIKKAFEDNMDKLSDIGFSVDGYSGIDSEIDTKEFQNAFIELFGEGAEFGNILTSESQSAFDNIIGVDKIGVSIIDAYV